MSKTSAPEESGGKYVHDPNLQKVVEDIVNSGEFDEFITDFKVVAVFAKGKAPADREAASCRKIANAIRTVSKIDFLLVFWREPWDQMTSPERHKLVVHEIMHIGVNDKGEPKIRRHSGDFCEIPEHDKESAELAKKIPISAALRKFDRQGTL